MQALAYYNQGVTLAPEDSIGQALRAIQGELKNTDVARRALGPAATADEIRDFANYYSRIAYDRVPNVGLRYLRLMAKGLGFDSLTAFFAQIEGLAPLTATSPQTPPEEADPDDSLPAFESEERIAQNVLRLLTKLAGDGIGRLEGERVEDHRLSANPRAIAAERPQFDRKDRRRDVQETKKRRPRKRRPK